MKTILVTGGSGLVGSAIKQVLTSKFVPGSSIDTAVSLPQNVRNAIARTMLLLTLRELFQWRFIQSGKLL